MRIAALPILALMVATPAHSAPKADRGTEKFCTGFQETVEGFWLNEKNKPVLGFRYASNKNGTGCYAWLNKVPDWNIGAAGSMVMEKVRWNGARRSYKKGKSGIYLDLGNGGASYVNQSGKATPGYVLK